MGTGVQSPALIKMLGIVKSGVAVLNSSTQEEKAGRSLVSLRAA